MAAGAADEAIGKREAERERDLQRPWHGDALIFDAPLLELVDGAAGKLISDVLIEPGLDN